MGRSGFPNVSTFMWPGALTDAERHPIDRFDVVDYTAQDAFADGKPHADILGTQQIRCFSQGR